jgi:hypothetical protein
MISFLVAPQKTEYQEFKAESDDDAIKIAEARDSSIREKAVKIYWWTYVLSKWEPSSVYIGKTGAWRTVKEF